MGTGLASKQSHQGVIGLNVFKRHVKPGAQASGVDAQDKGPKGRAVEKVGFNDGFELDGRK